MENKIIYYLDAIESIKSGKYIQPVTIEIDPSNNCNLNCSFCMYSEQNKRNPINLQMEDYQKVIDEIFVDGTKSITFTGGGEPTVNKNFNNMVNLALSYGFEVGLITNGVLLETVENKSKFKFIRVSLNAATGETYQKVTGKNYFDKVVNNILEAIKEEAFVGWSFVVNPDNKHEIEIAVDMAKKINVKYIQFKPAIFDNGTEFNDYQVPNKKEIIDTRRYRAKDHLPCIISHLIAVLGADSCLYYCCQKRGLNKFRLGSIKEDFFYEVWKRRFSIWPDVTKCPHCRGMNYATAYEKFISQEDITYLHRHFL